MKKIKHIFLTLMLICLIVPPTSVFAEPEEAKPEEQKTEEAKPEEKKEEEAKPEEKEEENPKVDEENDSPDLPSGENKDQSDRFKETIKKPMETPASVNGEIYNGSGTVVDFTTTGSKAFYTVKGADNSSIYYIVIDMDKTENNVYFLSEINGEELSLNEVTSQNSNQPEEAKPELPEENPKKKSNQNPTLFIVIIGAIALFGYQFFFGKLKNLNPLNKKKEEEDLPSNEAHEEGVYLDQEAKNISEEETYVDENEDDN